MRDIARGDGPYFAESCIKFNVFHPRRTDQGRLLTRRCAATFGRHAGRRYCETDRLSEDAWSLFAAMEVFKERNVCRDFAHLAVAFRRCLNIPARCCTGYLGDIGVPPCADPMDFSAWFEAFLGGRWYTFDARSNVPRIGRVLIARGRDASDVAISSTFGPNTLAGFTVWTEEVDQGQLSRVGSLRR